MSQSSGIQGSHGIRGALGIGMAVECVDRRSYTDGGGVITAIVWDERKQCPRYRVEWAGGTYSDELASRLRPQTASAPASAIESEASA